MNRFQNNNDEISVYVCKGDVCNRVPLGGRGQGRVKENYDDQVDQNEIKLNSIATKVFGDWSTTKGNIEIGLLQTLRIGGADIFRIEEGVSLTNHGTIIIEGQGKLIISGLLTNESLIFNKGNLDIFGSLNSSSGTISLGKIINTGDIRVGGSFNINGMDPADQNSIPTLLNETGARLYILCNGTFTLYNGLIENRGLITNNGEMIIFGDNRTTLRVVKDVITTINNQGVIVNNNYVKFEDLGKSIFMSGNSIISDKNNFYSKCYNVSRNYEGLLTDCRK